MGIENGISYNSEGKVVSYKDVIDETVRAAQEMHILGYLTEGQRVVLLRRAKGESETEIANESGVTRAAVSIKSIRGLRNLKRIIEQGPLPRQQSRLRRHPQE